MKKLISLILILACLMMTLTFAFADNSNSWTCPTCGQEYDGNYNFCPADGTAKTISSGSWPVRELNGYGTSLNTLKDESMRHQSYFGPEKGYPGAGAYKPYKVTSMKALLKEGDYVLVDMSYRTVGRRILYFKASSLTNDYAESIDMQTTYPATTTASVQPLFGPGSYYDKVVRKIRNSQTGETRIEKVILDAGTNVNVFFEADGWVFAEFNCAIGTIRAWLPANQVK